MRILGISGSLRRGSHNRRLLRAAGDALPPGAVLVEWEGLAGLPAFDEDLEASPPEPVQELFDAIEDADALLIATPEYNASLPGALKNALDWASRPFPDNVLKDKPAAVDRREHRPVRRRLGAGRGAQGAQGVRRARARVRAAGRPRRRRVHRRTAPSPTPSCPRGWPTSSPISPERWPRRSNNRHDRSRGRPSRPRPRPDPQGARRRGAQPQADPRGRGRARRGARHRPGVDGRRRPRGVRRAPARCTAASATGPASRSPCSTTTPARSRTR